VVGNDGTVIVSNFSTFKQSDSELVKVEGGSLSTWIGGPKGGRFVGNFPMTNAYEGGFIAVSQNGTIYFNDVDAITNRGSLWSVSCPAGACGHQTLVAGVAFSKPGGMVFDFANDLLANDLGSGSVDTFELPNPKPKTFPVTEFPYGLAINRQDHHLFITDSGLDDAREYEYPSGAFVGSISCGDGCNPMGIAIDP
jgi:hypothetical protein